MRRTQPPTGAIGRVTILGMVLPLLATACANPCPEPPAPGEDPLVFLSHSKHSRFFETTDVAVGDGVVYTCSGIRSLGVHDASDPERLRYQGKTTFPDHQGWFPRCSHLDLDGDRLLVTARQDELQIDSFAALLDVSDPLDPQALDTMVASGSYEEGALVGDRAVLSAHHDGVEIVEIDGDRLASRGFVGGLGNVTRVAATADGGALVGGQEGAVIRLDADLQPSHQAELGAPVQALLELDDGRIAAAVGSAGVVLLDADLVPLAEWETAGTALRLDQLGSGELLVVNWSDVRIYALEGDDPVLRGVESAFESNDQPRILAGGARDDIVYAGAWEGLYAYRYQAGVSSPELSPGSLSVKVPADGEPQQAELLLANDSAEELLLGELFLPKRWSVVDAPTSIEPWGLVNLLLDFEGAKRKIRGELEICSDDPDERPARVALQAGSSRQGVGDAFPDFDYTGLNDGERHGLAEHAGEVVLLAYFATF
jgi:hypothetical protein